MSKKHYYSGPEFQQESETARGTGIKLQVLNAGLESIALEIGRTYFPQVHTQGIQEIHTLL